MQRTLNLMLVLFMCSICRKPLLAQQDGFQVLEKIQGAYKERSTLSFGLKYLYAKAQEPSNYLDSLEGIYKISAGRTWSMVDNIESITNSDIHITVYHNDKIIFLDQPDSSESLSVLAQMDSLLKDRAEVEASIKGNNEIQLRFLKNPLYSSASLHYDPVTFLLEKIVYTVESTAIFGEGGEGKAMVQIIFSKYSTAPIDSSLFASANYVSQKEKDYSAAGKYESYQILLGSSKFQN